MASMKLSRQNMPDAVHAANALRPFRSPRMKWSLASFHTSFDAPGCTVEYRKVPLWNIQFCCAATTGDSWRPTPFQSSTTQKAHFWEPNGPYSETLLPTPFHMCPSKVLREQSTANCSSQRQAVAMQQVKKLMPKDAAHFYAFSEKNRPPTLPPPFD